MEKINLEKILKQHSNICWDDYDGVIDAMKEAIRQTLVLVAKEVRLTEFAQEFLQEGADDAISKNSIFDVINLIE